MNRQGPDNSGDWYVPLSNEKTTLQRIHDFNDSAVDVVISKFQGAGRKIIALLQWLQLHCWTSRTPTERSRIILFAFFGYLTMCFIRMRKARAAKLMNRQWNKLFPTLPSR